MGRLIRLLLLPALLAGAFLSQQSGYGQTPITLPEPAGKAPPPKSYDYNPLPDLPRPADAPASLLHSAPAEPPYSCAPLPGPYFEHGPLFDPPELPQPGWYAELDLTALKPHVQNRLSGLVPIGANAVDQVRLPSAPLNWAAAPHVLIGYRLPCAFGGIALGYRGFASQGTSTFAGADGPASLHSRLNLNQIDLDYQRHEVSLWPKWEMQWHIGLRLSYVYFDSRSDEELATAAAGTGVFEQRESNSYWGIGPHAGFELQRHIDGTGLCFLVGVDVSSLLGRVRQGFFETSTTTDANGQFLTGASRNSGSQAVPIVNFQAGLNWQPPQLPGVGVFLGYQYEYWWNVGRLSTTPDSRAAMKNQGIMVRLGYNY
jgi:hypothetical protein